MLSDTRRSKHENYIIDQKKLGSRWTGEDIVLPLAYVLKIRDVFQGPGGHRPKDATVLLAYVAYMLHKYKPRTLAGKYAGWNRPEIAKLAQSLTKLNLLTIAHFLYIEDGQNAFLTEYVTPDGTGPVYPKETPTGIFDIKTWFITEKVKISSAESVIKSSQKTIQF